MKKVIGIIYTIQYPFDETYIDDNSKGGIGGSETWAIQLTNAISQLNDYHVILFCNCEQWHFSNTGVEYVPFSFLTYRCTYQHFDALLIARQSSLPNLNLRELIESTKCCDNVYTLSQDLYLWNKDSKQSIYDKELDYIGHIKKHFVLTEFQKQFFINDNKFPEDKLSISPNGIDLNLFNNIDIYNTNRDHNIFWSIRPERNFDILVDKIYPLVKKEISDCKIYICSYENKVLDKYKDNKDIINLGSLTKTELYKERIKHATFFYHPTIAETFGITILEAIMCGNDIVMTDLYGPGDILYPYKDFLLPNDINYFDNDEHCQLAANMIIDSILNYNDPQKIKLRNSMRNYIIKNYNWNIIAKNILKEMDVCEK